jgi:hypothetical protein
MSHRKDGEAMDSNATTATVTPIAADVLQHVQVLSTTMRIHDLTIEQPAVIEYLRRIAPSKQEIALVHALEVGITAMQSRRDRGN